tara:strand:+ start:1577 stop:3310 length:1734 start_codon:yes stop_codon:yes gene_type:complete
MAEITAPEYISPYVVTVSGGLVLDRDVYTMPVGAATILQNFEPSVKGGYRRLSGTAKYDANLLGGATDTVLGVAIFADKVIAASGTIVQESSGSGWSSIDTGRTSAGRYRFEEYNFTTNENRLIFADGANFASFYNGTTVVDIKGSTTISATGSASSSSTSLSVTSAAGIAEGMYIGGTNIGSGAKVSSVSGTTITMSVATTGTISSASVTFAGLGTAPTNPSMIAAFKNHMFYAGMSAEPNTIIFSAIGDENDFTSGNGAGSLNVDSTIVAIKSFRESLMIFCEDRIYKLTGNALADFAIEPVSRNVGCSDAFSVQEIGGDILFLAPDGLRTVAGTARIGDVELGTVSKQIQDRINDIRFDNVSSVVIRGKSQYRLFYPTTGGLETSAKGLIGVLKSNPQGQLGWEYSDIRGLKPSCCVSGFVSGVETIIHGGYDGYVYKQESGNTFAGTAMTALYRSPDLTMGDAGIRKTMQRINVNYDPEGAVNVSLFVKYDFEDAATPQPAAYTLTTADTAAVYGNSGSLYGSAVYGAEGMPIVRQSVEGSGFTVVIRLTDTSSNPPITLKGFELEFTPGARM